MRKDCTQERDGALKLIPVFDYLGLVQKDISQM